MAGVAVTVGCVVIVGMGVAVGALVCVAVGWGVFVGAGVCVGMGVDVGGCGVIVGGAAAVRIIAPFALPSATTAVAASQPGTLH
jgi:hypothetical protein